MEETYQKGWVFIKFVGTHAEFDKVDAQTVNHFKDSKISFRQKLVLLKATKPMSDIFKKNRKLNLDMVRKLYNELHIPLETLVKEY